MDDQTRGYPGRRALGRLRPPYAARRSFASLAAVGLFSAPEPEPPRTVDRSNLVPDGRWILGANDRIGTCTIVACANAILLWTSANGTPHRVSDDVVVSRYSEITGYDPADPASDCGAAETTVLMRWSIEGWLTGRPTMDVALWQPVNIARQDRIKSAIWRLGGLYVGLQLPLMVEHDDGPWIMKQVGGAAAVVGGLGGHAVFVIGYDDDGLTFISWGKVMRMSWGFFQRYVTDGYALLDRNDWLSVSGLSPANDTFDQLRAALDKLAA